jgi:hypothetical protein
VIADRWTPIFSPSSSVVIPSSSRRALIFSPIVILLFPLSGNNFIRKKYVMQEKSS